jgi:hypothetical protein
MIVGIDVSSRRIDLAYLDAQGRPQRWHQELGDPRKVHLIDRLRSIHIQWPAQGYHALPEGGFAADGEDVTDVAIEYPFGRGNAIAALMATTGIITRQAPPWARVAWPSSGELRAAIGARNTKQAAHEALLPLLLPHYLDTSWDEHELDALTACIGWTKILEAQDTA